MTEGCLKPEELSRALAEGATIDVAAHVAACESCGREWREATELRALARALPPAVPAPERVASVRARVIARGAAVRRAARLGTAALAAFALAAGAVLAIGLSRPEQREPEASSVRRHGTVVARAGARYSLARGAPDELVVLESGRIHVTVSPLGPGERFRVQAPDGEVEVRGTAFDVTVESGHLSAVAVDHGRVEVHSRATPDAVLGAGESWRGLVVGEGAPSAPVPVADSAPVPLPTAPSPSTATAHRNPSAARAPEARDEATATAAAAQLAMRSAPAPTLAPTLTPASATAPAPTLAPAPAPAASLSPSATAASTVAPVPPSHDDRREEERRERRDERRERQDQRRLR